MISGFRDLMAGANQDQDPEHVASEQIPRNIAVRVYVVGVNEKVLSETDEWLGIPGNLSGNTGIVCSPHGLRRVFIFLGRK